LSDSSLSDVSDDSPLLSPTRLRDCGITADQRLYWLHYNVLEQGSVLNTVVVLAADGSTVHRSTFSVGKTLTFTYRGQEYSLDIPAPELPG